MSRHQVPLREDIDATSAWVGWDRPLQTFFVQVFKDHPTEPGEETELLWVGSSEKELPRPVDALLLLEPYCIIPDELPATLEIDRMKTLAATDGPNQVEAKAFLARIDRARRSQN